VILLISASQVARITGLSHLCLAYIIIFIFYFILYIYVGFASQYTYIYLPF
jgi:hypothetical protein